MGSIELSCTLDHCHANTHDDRKLPTPRSNGLRMAHNLLAKFADRIGVSDRLAAWISSSPRMVNSSPSSLLERLGKRKQGSHTRRPVWLIESRVNFAPASRMDLIKALKLNLIISIDQFPVVDYVHKIWTFSWSSREKDSLNCASTSAASVQLIFGGFTRQNRDCKEVIRMLFDFNWVKSTQKMVYIEHIYDGIINVWLWISYAVPFCVLQANQISMQCLQLIAKHEYKSVTNERERESPRNI